jgi:hypothetical protein
MKRIFTLTILPSLIATVSLGLTLIGAPAGADSPAATAPVNVEDGVRVAFESFARSWMEKVQRMADEQKPAARPGASTTQVTYRDFGDDFTVALRPTGHAVAPYVGILRYQEQVFSCRDMGRNNCTLSSQTPVTEIFRYQGGRWVY